MSKDDEFAKHGSINGNLGRIKPVKYSKPTPPKDIPRKSI